MYMYIIQCIYIHVHVCTYSTCICVCLFSHSVASGPQSLQMSELPPHPVSVTRSLSDSGYGNTGMGRGNSISQEALQQALNLAMSHAQVYTLTHLHLTGHFSVPMNN